MESLATTIDPSFGNKWFSLMTLIQRILSQPMPPISHSLQHCLRPPDKKIILKSLLPRTLVKAHNTVGLQHKDENVVLTILTTLDISFNALKTIIHEAQNIINELQKNSPSLQTKLISLWTETFQQLIVDYKYDFLEIKDLIHLARQRFLIKTDVNVSSELTNSMDIFERTNEEDNLSNISTHQMIDIVILRLLYKYIELFPNIISDIFEDIVAIIKGLQVKLFKDLKESLTIFMVFAQAVVDIISQICLLQQWSHYSMHHNQFFELLFQIMCICLPSLDIQSISPVTMIYSSKDGLKLYKCCERILVQIFDDLFGEKETLETSNIIFFYIIEHSVAQNRIILIQFLRNIVIELLKTDNIYLKDYNKLANEGYNKFKTYQSKGETLDSKYELCDVNLIYYVAMKMVQSNAIVEEQRPIIQLFLANVYERLQRQSLVPKWNEFFFKDMLLHFPASSIRSYVKLHNNPTKTDSMDQEDKIRNEKPISSSLPVEAGDTQALPSQELLVPPINLPDILSRFYDNFSSIIKYLSDADCVSSEKLSSVHKKSENAIQSDIQGIEYAPMANIIDCEYLYNEFLKLNKWMQQEANHLQQTNQLHSKLKVTYLELISDIVNRLIGADWSNQKLQGVVEIVGPWYQFSTAMEDTMIRNLFSCLEAYGLSTWKGISSLEPLKPLLQSKDSFTSMEVLDIFHSSSLINSVLYYGKCHLFNKGLKKCKKLLLKWSLNVTAPLYDVSFVTYILLEIFNRTDASEKSKLSWIVKDLFDRNIVSFCVGCLNEHHSTKIKLNALSCLNKIANMAEVNKYSKSILRINSNNLSIYLAM